MTKITLGIIGGGQLGSMMASSAKELKIKTIIFSDDHIAPGQMFCDEFIFGDYNDISKIKEFTEKVDVVTFEFENIPYDALKKINEFKKVLPKPEVNKIIQNRLTEKEVSRSACHRSPKTAWPSAWFRFRTAPARLRISPTGPCRRLTTQGPPRFACARRTHPP